MATIDLYQKNGLKRGPPIGYASFSQVMIDPHKKEYFISILPESSAGGPLQNRFVLYLANSGSSGNIRVQALGRESRLSIASSGFYEVLV